MKDNSKKEIRELLNQIGEKTQLVIGLSDKYDVEPNTIRNHWFGPLLSVPKKHRESLLEYLEEIVKNNSPKN